MTTDLSKAVGTAPNRPITGWWVARYGFASEADQPGRGIPIARPDARASADAAGHRELTIFTSPDATLPPSARDASCVALFDGVLDNRAELQQQLAGPEFASCGDADLVLHAYRRWGEKALAALRGRFALVLWDARQGRLLAVRDPLGTYPLFYTRVGPDLLLSTSTDALLQQRDVSRQVDPGMLACILWHCWPVPEDTVFSHIKRIPPGHLLRVTSDETRVTRCWNPVPSDRPVDWIADDEIDEKFEQTMTRVLDRYLNIGPAGIFLSGGIDSVSIAAVAMEVSRDRALPPPWALSLVFPDPNCNEEDVQRGVARGLGLPQVLLPFDDAVGPSGLLPAALEFSRDWPAPLLNTWWPAYHTLATEGKRRGCAAILTGSGGDEWLGVNPALAADLLRAGDLGGLFQFWQTVQRSYGGPPLTVLRAVLWTYGLRLLLPAPVDAMLGRVAALLPGAAERRAALPTAREWVAPDPALRRDVKRRVEEAAQTEASGHTTFYMRDTIRALDHPLLAMEKEEVFEAGRRLGVPLLRPYWDADLVELLMRTPPHLLNKGGKSKGLVRASLAQRFPHLGFERQKKVWATGFFRDTMRRQGPWAWHELGGAKALATLGVVDAAALDDVVDQIGDADGQRQAPTLWEVLSLEAWLRPRL